MRACAAIILLLASLGGWTAIRVAGTDRPAARAAAWWHGGRLLEGGGEFRQLAANDCGPAALARCLHALGEEITYPDPGLVVPLGRRGCALGELAAEASRRGHRVAVERRPVGELERIDPPAVLFLRRGHFVALEGFEAGEVLVHDPAIGRLAFPPAVARRQWSGDVLWFPRTCSPE